MELTRRDALGALISAGVLTGGAAAALSRDLAVEVDGSPDGEAVLTTLVDVAEVVYPSAVSNVPAFVETYASERFETRPERFAAVQAVVGDLDEYTRTFTDAEQFTALEAGRQDDLLQEMGANTADPDPAGRTAERVRYYLINEVLFALYASPTGGKLVGIENPQGHPGGTHSYRRGPDG